MIKPNLEQLEARIAALEAAFIKNAGALETRLQVLESQVVIIAADLDRKAGAMVVKAEECRKQLEQILEIIAYIRGSVVRPPPVPPATVKNP